jgi:hypothetical protein
LDTLGVTTQVGWVLIVSRHSRFGPISPTLQAQNKNIFIWQQNLVKLCQNVELRQSHLKYTKFDPNVVETEHLSQHLIHTGTFAPCKNWFVKLTQGLGKVNHCQR